MMNLAKRLWKEEEGQGMVEYGLILALVSIVAVFALGDLGKELITKFTAVKDGLTPAP